MQLTAKVVDTDQLGEIVLLVVAVEVVITISQEPNIVKNVSFPVQDVQLL